MPALAYYLRGDECPRCMAVMIPRPGRFTDAAAVPAGPAVPAQTTPEPPPAHA